MRNNKHALAKASRAALAFVLAFAMCFPLAGCRDSDVLTQKVIDATGEAPVDYSLDPLPQDNSSASKQGTQDEYQDETDNKDDQDQEQSEPDYSSDATNNGETASQEYGSNVYAGEASDGGSADGSGSSSSGDGVLDAGTNSEKEGTTITINTGSGDDPTPENTNNDKTGETSGSGTWSGSNNGGNGAGNGGEGKTYADGVYDNVPHCDNIAAVGPYATIVQSLGGRGALAAAPSAWLSDLPSAAYDGGNELTEVTSISSWSNAKGASMSDAAVQEIISSGAKCLLTSNSYNITSTSQREALNKAGVNVVVMPDIGVTNALDSDIETTVEVIGEILSEADGLQYDAKSASLTWKQQHQNALDSTLAANGGYTCVYFSVDWATGAGAWLENYLYKGKRLESKNSQNRISNVSSTYIDAVYVEDWYVDRGYGISATLWGDSERSSYELKYYYFQHCGLADVGGVVSGDNPQSGQVKVAANLLDSTNSNNYKYGTFHSVFSSNSALGLSDPVVIAEDRAAANKISVSAHNAGSECNTGVNYDIWVMPTGVSGSWAAGNFESFLMAPWGYSVTRNSGGTSACDAIVSEFYSTFFRPSDINSLLTGYGEVVQVRY